MEQVHLPDDNPEAVANRELTVEELIEAGRIARQGIERRIAERAATPTVLEQYRGEITARNNT